MDKEQIMDQYTQGSIKEIFPIQIYEAEFPNFDRIKQHLLDSLEPHFKTLAPGNEYVDGNGKPLIYRTLPNLQLDPAFKELIEFVEYHGRIYWKQLNLTSRAEPSALHVWSNKIPPGGFTPTHVHTPIPIASAFYINASDDMGTLEIENPIDTINKLAPRDNALAPYFDTHQVKVRDGKLAMFPGWMRHFTRSNMSKQDRVVMSFNIGANVSYHGKDN
jgi:uncharacterized protein (TIGR02466 family)